MISVTALLNQYIEPQILDILRTLSLGSKVLVLIKKKKVYFSLGMFLTMFLNVQCTLKMQLLWQNATYSQKSKTGKVRISRNRKKEYKLEHINKTKNPHQRTRRKENISSWKIKFYQTPTNATKGQILGLPKKKSVWGWVRVEVG